MFRKSPPSGPPWPTRLARVASQVTPGAHADLHAHRQLQRQGVAFYRHCHKHGSTPQPVSCSRFSWVTAPAAAVAPAAMDRHALDTLQHCPLRYSAEKQKNDSGSIRMPASISCERPALLKRLIVCVQHTMHSGLLSSGH